MILDDDYNINEGKEYTDTDTQFEILFKYYYNDTIYVIWHK